MASEPDEALLEEVRVAMALNGGVSLAVWMGGCAVELDAARRRSRPMYAALCQAFARVLVIDVMSGASAGGINGALLAAAIVNRRRLEPEFVRERWLELGDFATLLHRTSNADPRSLMQGEAFANDLVDTFKELIYDEQWADKAAPVGPPPDVKLDVTTTDVAGKAMRFVDFWGQSLEAREYRARFRFRSPEHYAPERLARAARASASFPLAFEPFAVTGEDAKLAGLEGKRWLIDGGLLDNAPIAAAIDLIPGRRARRQVRRFVCYVNAEPPTAVEAKPGEPPMAAIAGNVISLPRKAPFVDQLRAVDAATRRSLLADNGPDIALLRLDLDTLETTANALFEAYRIERTLASLDELLGSPGAATEVVRYTTDLRLPWIPRSLAPRDGEGRWQWGVLAAERAIHLLLDALRRATVRADPETRKELYAAWAAVGDQLTQLDAHHMAVLGASRVDNPLMTAIAEVEKIDPYPIVEAAVTAARQVLHLLRADDVSALFGETGPPLDNFLRRALALEVVRRSGPTEADIESGQELRFVQLTPQAPGLLFRRKPWTPGGWDTSDEKLLGIRLGHFAGFYRESWRANDFMWGRMDAAARIVEMLVAPGRVAQIAAEDWSGTSAWTVLAEALTEDASEMEADLLEEALAGMPAGYPREGETLRARLECALEHDLTGEALDPIERGRLTRLVCARAVQYEVFQVELPELEKTSARDAQLGAGTPALRFEDTDDGLRKLRDGGSLLALLAAPDEATSALALRTSAHAGLVALGALRAAKVPLARSMFGLRSLLLPIAGTVAQTWKSRFGVFLAFTAAAMLLAARITETAKVDTVTVDGSWASYLLLSAIALAVVVGAAFVPALRLVRGVVPERRALEGVKALGLLATGVGGAALVAWLWGDRSWTQLIAGPGAGPPPDWLMGTVIALVVGLPLAIVPAVLRGWLDAIVRQPWAGWPMLALFAVASGLVGAAAVGPLLDAWSDGSAWQRGAAALAVPGAPVVAFLCLRLWRKGVPERAKVDTPADVVQARGGVSDLSPELR